MADRLYLSYWLRGFSPINMTRHFERMLSNFPFSPLNPANTVLRVQAVSSEEPDVRENVFPDPLDVAAIGIVMQEAAGSDSCLQVEGFWGLWRYDNDWKLTPSPVTLLCFGPEFQGYELADGARENLRIEFGLESQFLVQPDLPNSAYYAQSNLKGLLQLSHVLDQTLAVEKRKLWSESGENFADRFKAFLQ